jgi:hypothetical protein
LRKPHCCSRSAAGVASRDERNFALPLHRMPRINGDRVFINSDFGELIIAKLSPAGYQEISRTHRIAPTTPASQRRTGGKINWTQPAYTDKHILARNDDAIISISLAAD